MGHQGRERVINVKVDQVTQHSGQGAAEGACGGRGTHLTDLILVYSTQTVVYTNTCTAHGEVHNNTCECAHTSTHLTAAPLAC